MTDKKVAEQWAGWLTGGMRPKDMKAELRAHLSWLMGGEPMLRMFEKSWAEPRGLADFIQTLEEAPEQLCDIPEARYQQAARQLSEAAAPYLADLKAKVRRLLEAETQGKVVRL